MAKKINWKRRAQELHKKWADYFPNNLAKHHVDMAKLHDGSLGSKMAAVVARDFLYEYPQHARKMFAIAHGIIEKKKVDMNMEDASSVILKMHSCLKPLNKKSPSHF